MKRRSLFFGAAALLLAALLTTGCEQPVAAAGARGPTPLTGNVETVDLQALLDAGAEFVISPGGVTIVDTTGYHPYVRVPGGRTWVIQHASSGGADVVDVTIGGGSSPVIIDASEGNIEVAAGAWLKIATGGILIAPDSKGPADYGVDSTGYDRVVHWQSASNMPEGKIVVDNLVDGVQVKTAGIGTFVAGDITISNEVTTAANANVALVTSAKTAPFVVKGRLTVLADTGEDTPFVVVGDAVAQYTGQRGAATWYVTGSLQTSRNLTTDGAGVYVGGDLTVTAQGPMALTIASGATDVPVVVGGAFRVPYDDADTYLAGSLTASSIEARGDILINTANGGVKDGGDGGVTPATGVESDVLFNIKNGGQVWGKVYVSGAQSAFIVQTGGSVVFRDDFDAASGIIFNGKGPVTLERLGASATSVIFNNSGGVTLNTPVDLAEATVSLRGGARLTVGEKAYIGVSDGGKTALKLGPGEYTGLGAGGTDDGITAETAISGVTFSPGASVVDIKTAKYGDGLRIGSEGGGIELVDLIGANSAIAKATASTEPVVFSSSGGTGRITLPGGGGLLAVGGDKAYAGLSFKGSSSLHFGYDASTRGKLTVAYEKSYLALSSGASFQLESDPASPPVVDQGAAGIKFGVFAAATPATAAAFSSTKTADGVYTFTTGAGSGTSTDLTIGNAAFAGILGNGAASAVTATAGSGTASKFVAGSGTGFAISGS